MPLTPAKLPPQTEDSFLRQVLELAAMHKWRTIHVRPARTKAGWVTPIQGYLCEGWPDVFLCRGHRLVCAELKSEAGKVTPKQTAWLLALGGAGVEVFVWRPSDLEKIKEILA